MKDDAFVKVLSLVFNKLLFLFLKETTFVYVLFSQDHISFSYIQAQCIIYAVKDR